MGGGREGREAGGMPQALASMRRSSGGTQPCARTTYSRSRRPVFSCQPRSHWEFHKACREAHSRHENGRIGVSREPGTVVHSALRLEASGLKNTHLHHRCSRGVGAGKSDGGFGVAVRPDSCQPISKNLREPRWWTPTKVLPTSRSPELTRSKRCTMPNLGMSAHCARPSACVAACLPLCVSACLHAYKCQCASMSLRACMLAFMPACLHYGFACVPACLRACMPACLDIDTNSYGICQRPFVHRSHDRHFFTESREKHLATLYIIVY